MSNTFKVGDTVMIISPIEAEMIGISSNDHFDTFVVMWTGSRGSVEMASTRSGSNWSINQTNLRRAGTIIFEESSCA